MSLNDAAIIERISKCNTLNLCYITMKRLDEDDTVVEVDYTLGNLTFTVKVISKYIKY